MFDPGEFTLGQAVAAGVGLCFFLAELIRLRRVSLAALEGVRFWAIIAGSEVAVWLACGVGDAGGRITIAALAPILIALVVNNAYAIARRMVTSDLAS